MRNDIPKELINWFVKAPSLKVSTPAVRVAYLDAMISMFKSDNLEQVCLNMFCVVFRFE